jgi:hypothetical protein
VCSQEALPESAAAAAGAIALLSAIQAAQPLESKKVFAAIFQALLKLNPFNS